MTGQPQLGIAGFAIILTWAACLPRDDLSSYSSLSGDAPATPATIPGRAGLGGGLCDASTGETSPGSASDAAAAAPDGTKAAEESGRPSVLDTSGVTGGAAAGDAGRGPLGSSDEDRCGGDGEFASADVQSCYRLTDEAATWLDARAACTSWGGGLVRIESAAEDDFLTARLTIDVWIGLNDREVEGTMVWADGTPLGFENWGNGQPDDLNLQEDCVEKRRRDRGSWNDRPCDGAPRVAVCEK